LINSSIVKTMARDIPSIIGTLRISAVNRCRERLDAAALKARELISKGGNTDEKGDTQDKPEYGITSVLKRRHGL
jgi:hypothetical protein